jgi:hypothetical protein
MNAALVQRPVLLLHDYHHTYPFGDHAKISQII